MSLRKPDKKYHRRIVSRTKHVSTSKRGGFFWLLVLECRHVVKLPYQRGLKASVTHCEKCSLGLVRAA